MTPIHILTFDIEEWFHILDFADVDDVNKWGHYEVRIYKNVYRILELLYDRGMKKTFFVSARLLGSNLISFARFMIVGWKLPAIQTIIYWHIDNYLLNSERILRLPYGHWKTELVKRLKYSGRQVFL